MRTIDIAQANGPLNQYARELDQDLLVLTDGGRAIAVLMPIDREDLEALKLAEDPKFQAVIEQARAEGRAGAGLLPEEVRRQLGPS